MLGEYICPLNSGQEGCFFHRFRDEIKETFFSCACFSGLVRCAGNEDNDDLFPLRDRSRRA